MMKSSSEMQQVGEDEAELCGSSVALFDDSDVAGIFYEKPITPPPAPYIPVRNETTAVSLGTKLKSLSVFDSTLFNSNNNTSPDITTEKHQDEKPQDRANDAVVEDLKEQISRLEQDNVTLLEELDNVTAESTECKNLRVSLEKTITDLNSELESTKSELRELSFNVISSY